MAEMAAVNGARKTPALRWLDVPEWLRLSVLDTAVTFAAGNADTCMHQPSITRPEPLLAAAWRPGLVTCRSCPHLFWLTGDADRTCDRCGYFGSGLPDDGITTGGIRFGPMAFAYALCVDCLAAQNKVTS